MVPDWHHSKVPRGTGACSADPYEMRWTRGRHAVLVAGRWARSDNGLMQQRLGHVLMADGTSVSFASVGTGRPLVYVMGWLTHLELSWELPAERAYYEELARDGRLVRYDRAGCGLSAASARPPSLAFELEQLAAVASTLGTEPFDLMGTSMGAVGGRGLGGRASGHGPAPGALRRVGARSRRCRRRPCRTTSWD